MTIGQSLCLAKATPMSENAKYGRSTVKDIYCKLICGKDMPHRLFERSDG